MPRTCSVLDYHVRPIIGADPKTFIIIDGHYGKDKNNVYFYGVKIKDSDSETFVGLGIGSQYAKDKNNVYHRGKIVKGATPANCIAENLDGCKGAE